ncbi:MAG: hypothetical protein KDB69_10770 [Acidimicrobiia bacterium]|nr:hypothetical protein [Acidimicrobiia bacterium]
MTFNLRLTGPDKTFGIEVGNGVLNYTEGLEFDDPTAELVVPTATFTAVVLGTASFDDLISDGTIDAVGDTQAFTKVLGLLDSFDLWFNIVTP